jgi:hypothetical protein
MKIYRHDISLEIRFYFRVSCFHASYCYHHRRNYFIPEMLRILSFSSANVTFLYSNAIRYYSRHHHKESWKRFAKRGRLIARTPRRIFDLSPRAILLIRDHARNACTNPSSDCIIGFSSSSSSSHGRNTNQLEPLSAIGDTCARK